MAQTPIRVPYSALEQAFERALLGLGFTPARAQLCAQLFAETTRDGVYTHGLRRFPRFVAMIENGCVQPSAEPRLVASFGAMERWDGQLGPGNLNAYASMNRALELARTHGLGAVFLARTNHWMRGGTYGWQAADAGFFAVCFTNTLANMPPWGASTPALGNNPLVLAVPRPGGANIVLDMAMSQYSFGTLSAYEARKAPLPYPGGFDAEGNLTTEPAAIVASGRALPVGLWKGSGLSMMLDLMASMLSGGQATHQIPTDPEQESGISQVFLAVDPTRFGDTAGMQQTADAILASLRDATPVEPGKAARYPGEQTLQLREENLRLGVPVDPDLWARLNSGGFVPHRAKE